MIIKNVIKAALLIFIVAVMAAACTNSGNEGTNNEPADSTTTETQEPELIGNNGILPPGTYCYSFSSESQEATITFTVSEKFGVTGSESGEIHDELNDYFAAFSREFKGVLNEDIIEATATTEIDGDTQEEDMLLQIGEDWLKFDYREFKLINCDSIQNQ